jgi:membrane protein required for colicin V production
MQTYDILMVLVLVGATLFGLWKGMAWQIASLASLVVSAIASMKFSAQLAPYFGQQAPLNRYSAMLAIYVGTSFIIWTLFRFVAGAIDKVRLESFDKQLGAMFGLAKGVLLCVAITFFAVTLLPAQGPAIANSQSGHYIIVLIDKAHSVLPPEVHQTLDPYLNKLEERLNPNFQPHAEDMQQLWQNQAQANNNGGGAPPSGWPQSTAQQQPPQQAWPASSQTPVAWPSAQQQQMPQQQQRTAGGDPYAPMPREPQPFPGPYSAERPASRDY